MVIIQSGSCNVFCGSWFLCVVIIQVVYVVVTGKGREEVMMFVFYELPY